MTTYKGISTVYGFPPTSPTWDLPFSNNYFEDTQPLMPPDKSKIQNESPTRNIAIYTKENLIKKLSEILNASGDLKSFYPCAFPDTMIASFYDLRHAIIALKTLKTFMSYSENCFVCYAKPDLVQGLTSKLALVEMRGPSATLSNFNYLNFLSAYGSIHYMTNFQLGDTCHVALVEYHDERVNSELDTKLDGVTANGMVFSVHQTNDDYLCTSCCCTRERSKPPPITFEHKIKSFWSNSPPPSFLDYKAPRDHANDNSLSYFSTNPFSNTVVKKEATVDESSIIITSNTPTTKTKTTAANVVAGNTPSKRSSIESQSSLLMSSDNESTATPTTIKSSDGVVKKSPCKRKYDTNEFDLERIERGEDNRTTFMIRNIPNKYTQQMLMDNINSTHEGTYDFLYLRIDFKNKCNVGYAFINFIDVNSVISFAKERVGKKWGKFNSEKVCSLSYANIQGKDALIKKFRNSNVMQEEEAYRPKIFYSSGPLRGEEEVFPDKEVEYENRPQKNGDRHYRHHR